MKGELDALEPEVPHAPALGRSGQVDLRNVSTGHVAGVGYRESCGDGLAAAHLEIFVVEGRVAQAVTECVERLVVLLRVPAIADLGTLAVADGDRCAPGGVPRPEG